MPPKKRKASETTSDEANNAASGGSSATPAKRKMTAEEKRLIRERARQAVMGTTAASSKTPATKRRRLNHPEAAAVVPPVRHKTATNPTTATATTSSTPATKAALDRQVVQNRIKELEQRRSTITTAATKTNTTTPDRKAAKQEAKRRVKEWAARNKAAQINQSPPVKPRASTPAKTNTTTTTTPSVVAPPPPTTTTSTTLPSIPLQQPKRMPQPVEQEPKHEEEIITTAAMIHQQVLANTIADMHNRSTMPYTMDPSSSTTTTTTTNHPTGGPSTVMNAAEQLIKQQVLANSIADLQNRPLPHTEPHPQVATTTTTDNTLEDATEEEEQPQLVMSSSEKKRTFWTMGKSTFFILFLLSLQGLLLWTLGSWTLDESFLPEDILAYWTAVTTIVTSTTTASNKLCFLDSHSNNDTSTTSTSVFPQECGTPEHPKHLTSFVECPTNAICRDGLLLECSPVDYYMVLDKEDQHPTCQLQSHVQQTYTAITNVLQEWTIWHKCHMDGPPPNQQHQTDIPMWPLTMVYGQLHMGGNEDLDIGWDLDLITLVNRHLDTTPTTTPTTTTMWMTKSILHVTPTQEVWIGLDPTTTTLPLPLSCAISLSLLQLLESIGHNLWLAIIVIFTVAISLTRAYPISSAVGLLIILILRFLQRRRKGHSQLLMDITQVRQMALDRMAIMTTNNSNTEEHVALHLRDAIAWELFPTNKLQRDYILFQVWPKVVADIRTDNRIRKDQKIVAGKPRDVWTWIAATTTTTTTMTTTNDE